jgi:hypothetical protein
MAYPQITSKLRTGSDWRRHDRSEPVYASAAKKSHNGTVREEVEGFTVAFSAISAGFLSELCDQGVFIDVARPSIARRRGLIG